MNPAEEAFLSAKSGYTLLMIVKPESVPSG